MPTWVEALNMMKANMGQANGVSPQQYARVTNEQAASILRFVMKVQTEKKLDAALVNQWYPLSLAISGWRTPGDKFLVTDEHRKQKLPDEALPILWTTALNVATVAQNKGVPFVAPTVSPQNDYKLVLLKAWEKMQADTAHGHPTPAQPLPPGLAPKTKSEGKSNTWLLLGLAYLATQKGGL